MNIFFVPPKRFERIRFYRVPQWTFSGFYFSIFQYSTFFVLKYSSASRTSAPSPSCLRHPMSSLCLNHKDIQRQSPIFNNSCVSLERHSFRIASELSYRFRLLREKCQSVGIDRRNSFIHIHANVICARIWRIPFKVNLVLARSFEFSIAIRTILCQ